MKKIGIWARTYPSDFSGGLSFHREYLIRKLEKKIKNRKTPQPNFLIYSKYKKLTCHNLFKKLSLRDDVYNLFWDHLLLPFDLKRKKIQTVFLPGWKLPFFKIYPSKEINFIFDLSPIKSPQSHSLLERIYFRLIIKKCIKRSEVITTNSNAIKKEIVDEYDIKRSKIKVIYPDIHPIYKKQINKNSAKKKEKYIFYAGGYRTRKNVENLIKATPYINKEYKVVLCGSRGKLTKKLDRIIKDKNLFKRIIQTEFLSTKELINKYKKAKVFVYPSVYEGFGLPPLEAMACGTAVAVSDIPVLNETAGKAALKFNPYNPKNIAEKINELIDNDELREGLIQEGYKQVQKFSWDKSANKLYNLLVSI